MIELHDMVREVGRVGVGARPEADVQAVIGRVDRKPAVGYHDGVYAEVRPWLAGELRPRDFIFEPTVRPRDPPGRTAVHVEAYDFAPI